MFIPSSERILNEKIERHGLSGKLLKFGIKFLDDALRGILPNDLILLGAPTGIGKTELCVQIALANLGEGKRVHFIALEAEPYEIERRLIFPLIAEAYYQDKDRMKLERKLNMTDWMIGKFNDELSRYEENIYEYFVSAFKDLFTFYKSGKFGVDEMIYNITSVCDQTDLIIIDHVHYFDWDDDNDNRAIKNIAKKVREVALEIGKPVILIAHLRKKDRGSKELCASADEFHGSSDLTKIATKIITIASAGLIDGDKYGTYFRIAKNRIDGSVTRFLARINFDYKRRKYEDEYKLGFSNSTKFEEVGDYPYWASDSRIVPEGKSEPANAKRIPYYQQDLS